MIALAYIIGILLFALLCHVNHQKYFERKYHERKVNERRILRARKQTPVDRAKMVENERKCSDDNKGLGGK